MSTAETRNLGPGFEQRYYEESRRGALTSELGRISVAEARADDDSDRERRWRQEVISALAETMDGRVRTEYAFRLKDGKLVAEDDEAIEDLAIRGHRQSIKMADDDSFYEFVPKRTKSELDEIREDQAMARGETDYNTTVKFSPYTEELDIDEENRSKLIAANQKPYWQRGMFRLKHWDEQEQKLYMITRSIDNSSVSSLQDVAEEIFGYKYNAQNSTDTVGETIRLDVKDNSWREISERVIRASDDKLSGERGGQWLQGRKVENAEDTQRFVESQHAIIDHISRANKALMSRHSTFDDYLVAFHNELYDQAALLDELRERGAGVFAGDVEAASAAAGHIAREEGKVYDACGLILDGNSKAANLAAQTGLESLLALVGQELRCRNPKCRKKVVVPTKDLEAGILSCEECGLVYDVCSKKSSFDKSKIKGKNLGREIQKESDWQRIKREDAEEKDIRKRQRILEIAKKKQALKGLPRAA